MIRIHKPKEPARFDERCRKRGRRWLTENSGYKRPRDYWSEFEPELRDAFSGRCGYCAMKVMKAQIDHFLSIDRLKMTGEHELVYE